MALGSILLCPIWDSIFLKYFLLDLNYGKRFNYHWYCEHILQIKMHDTMNKNEVYGSKVVGLKSFSSQ